ncbi:MAG: DMT family transporter [Luteolibacter sp.]
MTDPPSAIPTDRRGILLMLLSVVLFAANTLIIRGVSSYAPAADGWVASLLRGVCGLVIVAALYGSGRGFNPRRLIGSRLVMIRGVVGAIGILAFYISVTKLGAARAVVLNLTYPAFATIIAALWLKETITRAAILWMVLAFIGLLLFLGGDGKLLHPSRYDLLGLFGAMAAGWVVVVIRRLRHEEHPATIYASQAFYGLLASAPAVTKVGSLPPLAWVGLIAAAAVVCFAQLLMTKAYQALPVSRGSAMQMTLPLVTAVGGFAFFRETFHLPELAGAALTLLATWRVVAAR